LPQVPREQAEVLPYIKERSASATSAAASAAFINIDMEAVANWAERRNIAFSATTDLAQQDAVYELDGAVHSSRYADLARDPELANSQIHRFLILHKELEADDGELTRHAQVRRGFIARNTALWWKPCTRRDFRSRRSAW